MQYRELGIILALILKMKVNGLYDIVEHKLSNLDKA